MLERSPPTAPSDPTPSSPAQTPETISLPPENPSNAKPGCTPTAASDASHAASRDTAHTPPHTAVLRFDPFSGSAKSDSVPGRNSQIAAATPSHSNRFSDAAAQREKNARSNH